MDDFKPFIQLSRNGAKRNLKALNKGKSAQLFMYLLTEMDDMGIVETSYSQIMAATGMGSATVSSLLPHLANVGLITILDEDPHSTTGRYQVNDCVARFPLVGTSETKVPNGDFRAHTSETKATPYFVVVKDSKNRDLVDQETTTTTSLKHFQNESATAFKTEVPEDKRLRRLWQEYRLADEFAPAVMSTWIRQYGIETVLERVRWYLYAKHNGMARSGGWLRSALAQNYSRPNGFDDSMYLTDTENLDRYKSSTWSDGNNVNYDGWD